jgi:hypothetical protein
VQCVRRPAPTVPQRDSCRFLTNSADVGGHAPCVAVNPTPGTEGNRSSTESSTFMAALAQAPTEASDEQQRGQMLYSLLIVAACARPGGVPPRDLKYVGFNAVRHQAPWPIADQFVRLADQFGERSPSTHFVVMAASSLHHTGRTSAKWSTIHRNRVMAQWETGSGRSALTPLPVAIDHQHRPQTACTSF